MPIKLPDSPIILRGDEKTAYRDPAVLYEGGVFYLFYTLVETVGEGEVFLYTAMSKSRDLCSWTAPRRLTVADREKNYSSPGSIVKRDGKWVMCLQTYPRENGEKYANARARLYTMESEDLESWSEPRLLRVKGDIPEADMGRMIDPYIIRDGAADRWICFYKQNGISYSTSRDLESWQFCGSITAGENPCILEKDRKYYLFHSPKNGIGMMQSDDPLRWTDAGTVLYLGQESWDWARGRITAATVLDCTDLPELGRYLMFFHGSGPEDEETMFDTNASIGLAWSKDLLHWEWPTKA